MVGNIFVGLYTVYTQFLAKTKTNYPFYIIIPIILKLIIIDNEE